MSETRDLGVPLLVLLAGLGVLGWDLSAGAGGIASLAGVAAVLGAGGTLAFTLRKDSLRATALAFASLLFLAGLSPAFASSRLATVPWALGCLAVAFRVRTLPMRVRQALLAGAAVLALLGVFAALGPRASLRPVAGLALAGAFACIVNVFASRPRPEAPAPVGPTIGVFGGSFDPFHVGHRAICEAALKVVSRLLVVVSARPPHKAGNREMTPFHHRVAMSRLGIEGLGRVEIVELEGKRDGPSYTVETLDVLRRLYPPGTVFRLILGADSLQDFPLWRDWEGILERADLLVARRPGCDLEPPPEFEGRNAPITPLEFPAVTASSTEIRRRIAAGESPGSMLTPAVAAYVRDHGLYAGGETQAAAEPAVGDPESFDEATGGETSPEESA